MAEPCTVVKLSVTNLDQAVKDPALAALLAEGWSEVASVVVAPPQGGDPLLHIVLAPPSPETSGGGSTGWAHLVNPIASSLQLVILVAILAALWV